MTYEPRPSDRFTIGLWCTAFGGREVFGTEVRAPLDPLEQIRRLAGLGLLLGDTRPSDDHRERWYRPAKSQLWIAARELTRS